MEYLGNSLIQSPSSGGGGGVDTTAIHKSTAGEIYAITDKSTPIDDDIMLIEDSEDSNSKKSVVLTDLKNYIGVTPYVGKNLLQNNCQLNIPTLVNSTEQMSIGYGIYKLLTGELYIDEFNLYIYPMNRKVPEFVAVSTNVRLFFSCDPIGKSQKFIYGYLIGQGSARTVSEIEISGTVVDSFAASFTAGSHDLEVVCKTGITASDNFRNHIYAWKTSSASGIDRMILPFFIPVSDNFPDIGSGTTPEFKTLKELYDLGVYITSTSQDHMNQRFSKKFHRSSYADPDASSVETIHLDFELLSSYCSVSSFDIDVISLNHVSVTGVLTAETLTDWDFTDISFEHTDSFSRLNCNFTRTSGTSNKGSNYILEIKGLISHS